MTGPSPLAIEREARALRVTPGGVHSPVRAFKAMGMPPLVIAEAHGAHVIDQDGRRFVDWIGAWGPALLGHNHPAIAKAIVDAVARGVVFGLASSPEVELSERIAARVPGCEMVRLVVTGTEATMSAVRVARAATGRPGIIKFAGAYHGHADWALVAPMCAGIAPQAGYAVWRFERGELFQVESLMRSGFAVKNPQAVSTCSCGKSFSTGA